MNERFSSRFCLIFALGLSWVCWAGTLGAEALDAADAASPMLEKYAQYVEPISVTWEVPERSVVEFFSYNCNICDQVRAYVTHFMAHKPDSLEFVRFHVSSSNNVAWKMSQVAFSAATLADVEGQFHDALFDRNSGHGELFLKPDDVRGFFAGQEGGQDAAQLVGSLEVSELRAQISKKIKEAGVSRVPTFVVNQRYRVNWGSEMTQEEFTELLLAVSSLPVTAHPVELGNRQ